MPDKKTVVSGLGRQHVAMVLQEPVKRLPVGFSAASTETYLLPTNQARVGVGREGGGRRRREVIIGWGVG